MFRILTVTLALISVLSLRAQTKFRLGLTGGGTISRNMTSDTFPKNFSRRNKASVSLGLAGQYDLRKYVSIQFAANYVGKGYKVNNDTLGNSPSVVRRLNTINVPVGIAFRQPINGTGFIQERFGFSANFNLGKDSVSNSNKTTNPDFRITEKRLNSIYPMFYLGFGMGSTTENGDRFDFGITYYQSFSKDAQLNLQYGNNLSKSNPLNYRGGYVLFNFTYTFNLVNFKRSSDYME